MFMNGEVMFCVLICNGISRLEKVLFRLVVNIKNIKMVLCIVISVQQNLGVSELMFVLFMVIYLFSIGFSYVMFFFGKFS